MSARLRIRWWRVGVLGLITVGAGSASAAMFTSDRPPAPTGVPAVAFAFAPAGPYPGDLGSVITAAAPAAVAPPPVQPAAARQVRAASRPRSGSSTAARPRTTPRPADPFKKIPGAGPLGDLCKDGACE